jgi:hypothetical protein
MIDQVQKQGPSTIMTATTSISLNKQVSASMADSVMDIESSNPPPLLDDNPLDTHVDPMEHRKTSNNSSNNNNTMIPRQLNDPVLQQKLYDMVMNIS